MAASNIGWTERSWNPIRAKGGGWGCTKVSTGCANCYAESRNKNTGRGGNGKPFIGQWEFEINERMLAEPLHRKKPSTYFVMSMGDLFHEDTPFEFVDSVFAVMALCPQHIFQVLTKRPERMAEYLSNDLRVQNAVDFSEGWDNSPIPENECAPLIEDPLPNVHIGTSVENQESLEERLPHLLGCPAAVRWLSVEPMLEHIDASEFLPIDTVAYPEGPERYVGKQINWVVIGCESKGAYVGRLGDDQGLWLVYCENLVRQCKNAGVPVFVKQIPHNGKVLKRKPGKPWPDAWPKALRVQEFPIQQESTT